MILCGPFDIWPSIGSAEVHLPKITIKLLKPAFDKGETFMTNLQKNTEIFQCILGIFKVGVHDLLQRYLNHIMSILATKSAPWDGLCYENFIIMSIH